MLNADRVGIAFLFHTNLGFGKVLSVFSTSLFLLSSGHYHR